MSSAVMYVSRLHISYCCSLLAECREALSTSFGLLQTSRQSPSHRNPKSSGIELLNKSCNQERQGCNQVCFRRTFAITIVTGVSEQCRKKKKKKSNVFSAASLVFLCLIFWGVDIKRMFTNHIM